MAGKETPATASLKLEAAAAPGSGVRPASLSPPHPIPDPRFVIGGLSARGANPRWGLRPFHAERGSVPGDLAWWPPIALGFSSGPGPAPAAVAGVGGSSA